MINEFLRYYNGVGPEEQALLMRMVMLLAYGKKEQVEVFEAIVWPVLDGIKDIGGKSPSALLREALDAVGA